MGTTPVFVTEQSHGLRGLAGYSPWGRKTSDAPERLSSRVHLHIHALGFKQADESSCNHFKFQVDYLYPQTSPLNA